MPGLPVPLLSFDVVEYEQPRQQAGVHAHGSDGIGGAIAPADQQTFATGPDGVTDATGDEGNRFD